MLSLNAVIAEDKIKASELSPNFGSEDNYLYLLVFHFKN